MNWFYLLPQHLISRMVGYLAAIRKPIFLKNWMIAWFIRQYGVHMQEALISDYSQYKTFNDFFTRVLKPGARTFPKDLSAIVSPADGFLYTFGLIEQNQLFQAKNKQYSLAALLANHPELAQNFSGGSYVTIYLSPKNYHRFHMPLTGRLSKMIYVPGRLFPVNSASVNCVANLFARNERVISIFDTAVGKMAFIAVGALNVGSIHMSWCGEVAPAKKRAIQHWQYEDDAPMINRGEELGFFQMGSTIILLFESQIQWAADMAVGKEVRVGEQFTM